MGGMAAGAAWCGAALGAPRQPARGYALVEAIIGLAALALPPGVRRRHRLVATSALLPGARQRVARARAPSWRSSCLLILPQSILLGMTFPLMSAGLVRAQPRRGRRIGGDALLHQQPGRRGRRARERLRADRVGRLPGTLQTAGVLNLLIAAVVWLHRRGRSGAAPIEAARPETQSVPLLLAIAFFTGLASFVYEISWIRMLSLVLGASTHSFELMLVDLHPRPRARRPGGAPARRRAAPSRCACSPGCRWRWGSPRSPRCRCTTSPSRSWKRCCKGLARSETGYALFNLSGGAIAALVMLPATFCAGMTLPLITGALLRRGAGEARDRPRLRREHARRHRRRAARGAPRAAALRAEGHAARGRADRRGARPVASSLRFKNALALCRCRVRRGVRSRSRSACSSTRAR